MDLRPHRVASLIILSLSPACSLLDTIDASARVERRPITAVPDDASPRILCIVAHPDDEISFAGTLYKSATALGAACDVLTITNGEAGFKYSTLAERIYGLELTEEAIGRKHLPAIRREELSLGLSYLAVRDLYLLNEKDDGYSKDRTRVLDPKTTPWRLDRVRRVIADVLERGEYDFVFTHLPSAETHGHHQSATLLALEAVARIKESRRPVILGCRSRTKPAAQASGSASAPTAPATPAASSPVAPGPYLGLDGEPSTLPRAGVLPFEFDRTEKFGHDGRLNYKVVVNWAIAAHKSQGTMQLGMNRGDIEEYWLYAVNRPDAEERARAFFTRLLAPQFATKTYPSTDPENPKSQDDRPRVLRRAPTRHVSRPRRIGRLPRVAQTEPGPVERDAAARVPGRRLAPVPR